MEQPAGTVRPAIAAATKDTLTSQMICQDGLIEGVFFHCRTGLTQNKAKAQIDNQT